MCDGPMLPRDVTCLLEISYGGKVLHSVHGSGSIDPQDDGMDFIAGDGKLVADEFIPASLHIHNMHNIFMWGWLRARVCVMDVTTGVTACLFQGKLTPTEESPVVDVDGRLIYVTKPEPVTSMTYSGPPLQAKVRGGGGRYWSFLTGVGFDIFIVCSWHAARIRPCAV